MNFLRPVTFDTGRRISIGPTECHGVTDQRSDTLQQDDACPRLFGHPSNDDIDVFAPHLINATVAMFTEETIDDPTVVRAAGIR